MLFLQKFNDKPNEQNVVVNGRYLLVTLDSINIQGELKTSHKQTNLLDDSLRAGDIVTVLSDIAHGNLLGLCGVIPLDHKYVLNQRMGRLRVHSGYDPGFIRLKVNRNQNHFKMRGQGTYTWNDGRVFTGEWLNNNMHGFGLYRWPNGSSYEG